MGSTGAGTVNSAIQRQTPADTFGVSSAIVDVFTPSKVVSVALPDTNVGAAGPDTNVSRNSSTIRGTESVLVSRSVWIFTPPPGGSAATLGVRESVSRLTGTGIGAIAG